jgi:hypothetical protein
MMEALSSQGHGELSFLSLPSFSLPMLYPYILSRHAYVYVFINYQTLIKSTNKEWYTAPFCKLITGPPVNSSLGSNNIHLEASLAELQFSPVLQVAVFAHGMCAHIDIPVFLSIQIGVCIG